VIVFRSKCSDRAKILLWDTSGLVLISKQLQQGGFRWPAVMDEAVGDGIRRAVRRAGLARVQPAKRILRPSVAA
jgi:transposase